MREIFPLINVTRLCQSF